MNIAIIWSVDLLQWLCVYKKIVIKGFLVHKGFLEPKVFWLSIATPKEREDGSALGRNQPE